MVREYIACKRPQKRTERRRFKRLSLEKAVETAALAKNTEGRRSSHHRRRTLAQLTLGKNRMLAILPKLRNCGTFDELHDVVYRMTNGVKGLAKLYAYDTAYLIGIRLGLPPKRVYLHAGTREGAKALGFSGNSLYLEPSQLPKELWALKPYEMEDFLCIYEAAIRELRPRRT
jgi:hypothetical protein